MAKPHRAFEIELKVTGDTWKDVVYELNRIIDEVKEHGQDCKLVSGGYSSGGYVLINHDPNMTHDKYFEDIAEAKLKPHGSGEDG